MARGGAIPRIGVTRIFTAGTFDLFHPGHVAFLRECAAFGKVTVALNTDEFAERYKRRPIMSLEERNTMVWGCRYVHRTIVNEGDEDCRPAILQVNPTWIAHGNDWKGDALMQQMGLTQEWLDEREIKFLYLPYTEGVSTSELIERCRA